MVSWTGVLSSVATCSAVLIALWIAIFGPRRVTRPKLSVLIRLDAPHCIWIPGAASGTRDTYAGHYIVRSQVVNNGNEDARDVEVQMLRLWIINDDGSRVIDPLFPPLLLRWSWWPERSSPAAWLPKLLPGTSKHYDFLAVISEHEPGPAVRRLRRGAATGQPQAWIEFQTAYHTIDGDPAKNQARRPPGRYQLDFSVAASNAKTIYRTAHISFNGWRASHAEMFGEGGLSIEITQTSAAARRHAPLT